MYRRDLDLRAHLSDHAKRHGLKLQGPFHGRLDETLHPAARAAATDLVDAHLDHPMIRHVCSSQAFALNLFAGLEPEALAGVLRRAGLEEIAEVCKVEFEWTDPGWLAEATVSSPHATQIDVAIWSRLDDGSRHLSLVEVKLTEDDFSTCSAFESQRNDARDVCVSAGPFGGEPARCFQLRNHDRGPRRRYDDYLHLAPDSPAGDQGGPGCWFRGGTNQVMRQAALAAAAVAQGQADAAAVLLCAPRAHRAMWRRWREARVALASAPVDFLDLPADGVVDAHADELSSELAERYRLGSCDPNVVEHATQFMRALRRWDGEGLAVSKEEDPFPAFVEELRIEVDPFAVSQLVAQCHLGFHEYPYQVPWPLTTETHRGRPALRLGTDEDPRWLQPDPEALHATLIVQWEGC